MLHFHLINKCFNKYFKYESSTYVNKIIWQCSEQNLDTLLSQCESRVPKSGRQRRTFVPDGFLVFGLVPIELFSYMYRPTSNLI
jgi:hypothetical protein